MADYRQVLRAHPFTLAAADACGSFIAVLRQVTIIKVAVPITKQLFCVVAAEQIGNRDMLWAARHAVTAGCAGDIVLLF